MHDKNYDNRSGDIIGSLCGFLVVSVIITKETKESLKLD